MMILNPYIYSAPSSLLTGLVAYWALEEASGTRVDATGRGNDLSPTNAPGNGTGKVGSGLALALASLQYASKADVADLRPSQSFTLAGWVKFNTDPNIVPQYLCAKGTAISAAGIEYRILADTAFRVRASDGSGQTTASSTAPAAGAWFFVVARYDSAAATLSMLVNNAGLATTTSAVIPQTATGGSFKLGASPAASLPSDAIFDEWFFYARALSGTECTTLYNAGSGRTHPFVGT